jgi:hypothetical protein
MTNPAFMREEATIMKKPQEVPIILKGKRQVQMQPVVQQMEAGAFLWQQSVQEGKGNQGSMQLPRRAVESPGHAGDSSAYRHDCLSFNQLSRLAGTPLDPVR